MKRILLTLSTTLLMMPPLVTVISCGGEGESITDTPGDIGIIDESLGEDAVERFSDLRVQTTKTSFDQIGAASGDATDIKDNFGLSDRYYNEILEFIPVGHSLLEVRPSNPTLEVVFINTETNIEYIGKIRSIVYPHETPVQKVIDNLSEASVLTNAYNFKSFATEIIYYEGKVGRWDEVENFLDAYLFRSPSQSIGNIQRAIRNESNASYFFELFSIRAIDNKLEVTFEDLFTGETYIGEVKDGITYNE